MARGRAPPYDPVVDDVAPFRPSVPSSKRPGSVRFVPKTPWKGRTMTTKLYVANLSHAATEDALRAHFSRWGGVSDVEILMDRRRGEPRGLARVTMTSEVYASSAVEHLDGVPFDGLPLRVSSVPFERNATPAPAVKVTQQFREKSNMAYDLDCAGRALTVRVFPTVAPGVEQWRIEARLSDAPDALVASATASTRREALDGVARSWTETSEASSSLPALDWEAIGRALAGVRAI
jgi:hypothetical protein